MWERESAFDHIRRYKMKKGKKYLEVLAKVDRTKQYTLDEAVKLVKDVHTYCHHHYSSAS